MRVEERILLLLAIKERGRKIDFSHIVEKVIRDEGNVTKSEVEKVLNSLVSRNLVLKFNNTYAITEEGRRFLFSRLSEVGDELNLSYRLVLRAKEYYPKASKYLLPFLKGRAVSVIKVFSHEKDPINKIKPLFVRYAKYKPKKIFIQINSEKELLRFVAMHAIDFIPYVHKLNAEKPDWLILDLDAGENFLRYDKFFELIKIVAKLVVEVLEEHEIKACLKFSGSRGVQIWACLDNSELKGDVFALYRRFSVYIQREVEKKIQNLPKETLDEFYKVTPKWKPITTSVVAKKQERRDQILIDWSSMKKHGDVRAPFSMHYKTGLISCPIEINKLEEFKIEHAKPEVVVKNLENLSKAFELRPCSPEILVKRAERISTF